MTTDAGLFSVAGRRVLVTGGSHGLGAMLAAGLAEAGASVVVCGRDAAALDAVSGPLVAAGGDCTTVVADVSTEDGCRSLAAAVTAGDAPLDVLVNNAGAAIDAPIEQLDDATWDAVLAVNLKAVSHLVRFTLPALRASAHERGAPARVVNVGSIAGLRVGELDNYAYTASKAALHHFTKHLARRLAPHVTVNAIAPGPFPSRLMAGVLASHGEALARTVPLRRIGAPDDIVAAARYLCSPAGAWITGTILTVDGGLSLT